MIWLVEWRKIIVLHVQHGLLTIVWRKSAKWQREISKFKVLTTTWTHNRNSFIVYVYFNGASTSPFAACSVNNNGFEEEAVKTRIVTTSQMTLKWRFLCRCRRCGLSSVISSVYHLTTVFPNINSPHFQKLILLCAILPPSKSLFIGSQRWEIGYNLISDRAME